MKGSFLFYYYTLFFISCFLASSSSAKHNIISDQDSLLFLKAQIILDPIQILTKNWSTGSSVCNWIGVSCGLSHYRVTALNISNMGLMGTIAPQLGNLSFLASLDLSGNKFHGHFPSELIQLRRLKFLSLSQNGLSGEFPSWVGSLNQLEFLHLNNNSFTGSIPLSVTNLTNLKYLICYQNELFGSVPYEIFNVSSMEVLDLGFNHLYGSLPATMCTHLHKLFFISMGSNLLSGLLPSDLSRCSQLKYLSLSNNNFSGQIPKTFWNMENLEEAFFQYNNLVGTIPKQFNNLTHLQGLNLAYNHLTGTIPEELGSLMNLETLILEYNELIGTIPEGIFNISNLIYLHLGRNYFTGSLAANMGFGLPKLKSFSIYQNMISGVIPLFIANSSRLYELDLSDNNFGGTIPHFLGSLKYLEYLVLYGNKLTKDSSSSLELEFIRPLANCVYLKYLQLSENPFNGILPESVGNLSNSITVLRIAACGMSGEIPSAIGNLSNLLTLDLRHNQFISPLPTTFVLLQNLQFLHLGYNKLSETLACNFYGLQHISELYLQNNTFFGSIPECIGNATSLNKINLGANKLSSSIPMTLWNLSNLLELNLSGNFLNGSLSNQMGNMKGPIILDLSMNNLSGYIPDAIGSLQCLEFLSLANNLMNGMIPKSFVGLVSLVNLDLSENNLSGSIPVTFEKLHDLKKFNVSHNNLVGLIPSEGPFNKFTWESFIFNKGLCGEKKFHVPPCPLTSPEKIWTSKHLLILCFGLVALVVAITLVAYLLFRRKKMFQKSEEFVQGTEMKRISFYELQNATGGFDERNLLGKGSFGSVFKGTLRDGLVVAVKVFDTKAEGALKSFDIECEMLRNLRHRNLTQVITSCSHLDFKAIILEFMPNGSLENWLHSENHFLSLVERLNIMMDVAFALQYLHSGYPTPVVHADLKPSNVLLDKDKVAHVCDFGIAKMLQENSITYTNTLATFGYIAPEYGSHGLVSTKCDVYSFGILLMEVFTRKRPNDKMFNENLTLYSWVNNSIKNAMIDIIDNSLLKSIEEISVPEMMDYVMMIMNVALNCTREIPKERDSMEEIIATLSKIKLKL